MIPCVLTIGGTDPSGGAGLPADARACSAFGGHALPVVSAVVAQNTTGVLRFETVAPELLAAQLDHLLADITPQAIKTGMLPDARSIEIVAAHLKNRHLPLIIDPVLAPSTGSQFSSDETLAALITHLLPMAELVTPNWPEAEKLLNRKIAAHEAGAAAQEIARHFGPHAVLLKGGHAPESWEVCDWFFDGQAVHQLCMARLLSTEVRGTGCMLASAIAAQRAQGVELLDAIKNAKHWLSEQIQNANTIGKGRRVATNIGHR